MALLLPLRRKRKDVFDDDSASIRRSMAPILLVPGAQAVVERSHAAAVWKDMRSSALTWRPARPTDATRRETIGVRMEGTPDAGKQRYSSTGVRRPDAVAGSLRRRPCRTQAAPVPVLWQAVSKDSANGAKESGRPGHKAGSAALLPAIVRSPLVNHHKLRNLVWVWCAAAPGFGPDSPGQYTDYFPGLAIRRRVYKWMPTMGSFRGAAMRGIGAVRGG